MEPFIKEEPQDIKRDDMDQFVKTEPTDLKIENMEEPGYVKAEYEEKMFKADNFKEEELKNEYGEGEMNILKIRERELEALIPGNEKKIYND